MKPGLDLPLMMEDARPSVATVPQLPPLSLADVVRGIETQLAVHGAKVPLARRHELGALLGALDVSRGELLRFVHLDENKKYTRNLVATDGVTYTLMLLAWNCGKESPIHDHPCANGCWLRVVQGAVREHRYVKDAPGKKLLETAVTTATAGDVLYIDDDIGLHKVVNPSATEIAMTLHLYSPPFSRCCVWLDPERASEQLHPVVTYYSEYGEVVDYELPPATTCSAVAAAASHSMLPARTV